MVPTLTFCNMYSLLWNFSALLRFSSSSVKRSIKCCEELQFRGLRWLEPKKLTGDSSEENTVSEEWQTTVWYCFGSDWKKHTSHHYRRIRKWLDGFYFFNNKWENRKLFFISLRVVVAKSMDCSLEIIVFEASYFTVEFWRPRGITTIFGLESIWRYIEL